MRQYASEGIALGQGFSTCGPWDPLGVRAMNVVVRSDSNEHNALI